MTPFVLVDTAPLTPPVESSGIPAGCLAGERFRASAAVTPSPVSVPTWIRIAVREPAVTRRLLQAISVITSAARVG